MNLFFQSSEFKNLGFGIWLMSFGKWIIVVSSKLIVWHVTYQMSLVLFWANNSLLYGWQSLVIFACEGLTIKGSEWISSKPTQENQSKKSLSLLWRGWIRSKEQIPSQKYFDSIHKKISYHCDQCEYRATIKGSLIKSVNKNITYPCDPCNYKATTEENFKVHIDSIHKKISYSCDQCNYRVTKKKYLNLRRRSLHEGESFTYENCDKFLAGNQLYEI